MPLEIDMLSVGNADAIIVRLSNDSDEQVILIDAGHSGDADAIIKHISEWTTRKNRVDLLICTHPHDDHIGGVSNVLDNLKVGCVLIHEPEVFLRQLDSLRSSVSSKETKRATASLQGLSDVMQKIKDLEIKHRQPFAGVRYELLEGAVLEIVGPSEDFYAGLATHLKSDSSIKASKDAAEVVDEVDDTSPYNNSSVITLLTYGDDDMKYLFTADAGPLAFDSVLESAEIDLASLRWMQIPHHGSRSNLNSDLIQHFSPKTAFVSAKGGDGIHPSPDVIQLFKRRKTKVYGTYKGGSKRHSPDAPSRPGWNTARELDENAE